LSNELTVIYGQGREADLTSMPRPKRKYEPPPEETWLEFFGFAEFPDYLSFFLNIITLIVFCAGLSI
jgi:hypothetical protein